MYLTEDLLDDSLGAIEMGYWILVGLFMSMSININSTGTLCQIISAYNSWCKKTILTQSYTTVNATINNISSA